MWSENRHGHRTSRRRGVDKGKHICQLTQHRPAAAAKDSTHHGSFQTNNTCPGHRESKRHLKSPSKSPTDWVSMIGMHPKKGRSRQPCQCGRGLSSRHCLVQNEDVSSDRCVQAASIGQWGYRAAFVAAPLCIAVQRQGMLYRRTYTQKLS